MVLLTEEQKKQIGQRIKEARKIMGYSQDELAERVGYKVGTISKYEQGNRTPNLAMLQKIADALETELVFLLDVDGNPFGGREIPMGLSPDRVFVDWARVVDVPLELHTCKDENGEEYVDYVIEVDGVKFEAGNFFDLMLMNREHFLLLVRQFCKKWDGKSCAVLDALP